MEIQQSVHVKYRSNTKLTGLISSVLLLQDLVFGLLLLDIDRPHCPVLMVLILRVKSTKINHRLQFRNILNYLFDFITASMFQGSEPVKGNVESDTQL